MATTFRIHVDNKKSKDGKYWLYVKICQDRRYKRYKTSVWIDRKSDWNAKPTRENWVRASDPAHEIKNQALRDELAAIRKQYEVEKRKGSVSINKLAETKRTEDISPLFLPYAEKIAAEIKETGHIRNAKKYRNFCNKFSAFKSHAVFADIDTAFLKKFEIHLASLPNERKPDQRLSVNAIHAEMKTFRAILNRANKIDKIIDSNPFDGYKLKLDKTTKDKLNKEEIESIMQLELEPGSSLWHTRNAFMLSFFCAGIRAGDIIQLRWRNVGADGRISYQMDKNGKIRDLAMVCQAKAIINMYATSEHNPTDYIFPFMSNDAPWAKYVTYEDKKVMPVALLEQMLNKIGSINAVLNKNLKKMAVMAKIEKHVTFHVSRHSFATMALRENVDTMTLKGALAHSSLKTTETYLEEFNMDAIDSTLQRVFDQKSDYEKVLEQARLLSDDEIEKLIRALTKS